MLELYDLCLKALCNSNKKNCAKAKGVGMKVRSVPLPTSVYNFGKKKVNQK